jgi:hypothetical protein
MSKKPVTEKKPTDEAMATLLLDRQERVERCSKEIEALLKKERVAMNVPALLLIDGKVQPQIQLVAID